MHDELKKLCEARGFQPFLTNDEIVTAVAKYNPEMVVEFSSDSLRISYADKSVTEFGVTLDTTRGIKQHLLDGGFNVYDTFLEHKEIK